MRPLALVVLLLALVGCAGPASTPPAGPTSQVPTPSAGPSLDGVAVLVFSRTQGFRHDSIPAAVSAIERLGTQHAFTVTATEDPARFEAADLDRFDAVVWLSTTGDVLDEDQQAAFERYIRGGGGFVGVHAAADTEYDWPWYGALLGSYFASHPPIQPATVRIVDPTHPSTSGLPPTWHRTDEWYDFRTVPDAHILATVDEASYAGAQEGGDHPIAWCHPFDGGRSWYTAMGHTAQSWSEPEFLRHVLGGIRYAALGEGDCGR